MSVTPDRAAGRVKKGFQIPATIAVMIASVQTCLPVFTVFSFDDVEMIGSSFYFRLLESQQSGKSSEVERRGREREAA
jgi:hypothetical protein